MYRQTNKHTFALLELLSPEKAAQGMQMSIYPSVCMTRLSFWETWEYFEYLGVSNLC